MQQIRFRDSPCNGCPERHMRCKETCKKYAEWKTARDAEKNRVYQMRVEESDIRDYKVLRYERRQKINTKKKGVLRSV